MNRSYKTGIVYMLSASFLFSLMNVLVRELTQHYPVMEVVFFRAVFIPLILFFPIVKASARQLRTPNALLISIGFFGTLALYGLFSAFQRLPLADATAFAYSSILFLTILSPIMLKEAVGTRRWLAILVGFSAVVIMAKPTGTINSGVFYALMFALGDALCMAIIRRLKDKFETMVMVFYYTAVVAVLAGFIAWPQWVWPSAEHFGKFMILAIGSGFAQIMLTRSFTFAPAVVVAPMVYSSLIWGVIFGYLFYHEVPTTLMLSGAALLVMVGLYLIALEKKTHPSETRPSKAKD